MAAENILISVSNVMASLIILFYYLLFFAKGFTSHARKLLSIILIFLVIHVFVFITDADHLVTITVFCLRPA
ncbi:MAG: hypothetical protein K1W31_09730, partial [Lachnospiraceae bacterium]